MHSLGLCMPLGNTCTGLEELFGSFGSRALLAILLKQCFPLMCPEDLQDTVSLSHPTANTCTWFLQCLGELLYTF